MTTDQVTERDAEQLAFDHYSVRVDRAAGRVTCTSEDGRVERWLELVS